MATEKELSDFLKKNETSAYRRSLYAVQNEESALDIVQDSMLKLVENYSNKPVEELLFLFQRIISNNIMDWFRKQKSQGSVIKYINEFDIDDDESNFIDSIETQSATETPFDIENRKDILSAIDEAMKTLPLRQKEAFMLRYVEDFSVTETAEIMGCSEGSVKTHCSRSVAALSSLLSSKGISLKD